MPNDFSSIINSFNVALAHPGRAQVGLINAVHRNSEVEELGKGQTAKAPLPAGITLRDITPSLAPPAEAGQTITTIDVELEHFKAAPFDLTAEDDHVLRLCGVDTTMREMNIITAINTICEEVASTGYSHIVKNASRAYGAASTPILAGSDLLDITKTAQIQKDNKAPIDRTLVLGGDAIANLTGKFWKFNELGTTDVQRDGRIMRFSRYDIYEDAAVTSIAAGTGASYVLDGARVKGNTVLKVKTGTGTIIAGDIITIGTHKYVVKTALDTTSKELEIHAPGLMASASDGATVTVGAASTRCLALARPANLLVARQPKNSPDAESITIRDPLTGLHFELNVISGYRMKQFEVALAWGWKTLQPAYNAILQY